MGQQRLRQARQLGVCGDALDRLVHVFFRRRVGREVVQFHQVEAVDERGEIVPEAHVIDAGQRHGVVDVAQELVHGGDLRAHHERLDHQADDPAPPGNRADLLVGQIAALREQRLTV